MLMDMLMTTQRWHPTLENTVCGSPDTWSGSLCCPLFLSVLTSTVLKYQEQKRRRSEASTTLLSQTSVFSGHDPKDCKVKLRWTFFTTYQTCKYGAGAWTLPSLLDLAWKLLPILPPPRRPLGVLFTLKYWTHTIWKWPSVKTAFTRNHWYHP